MAITVYGVDPSIDELHWSLLLNDLGNARAGSAVSSGLSVGVATGTRLVSVAAGRSIQAGTLADMTATQTLTLAANGGSQPRISLVCLQVNWSGTSATAGTLVEVQGTPAASPVAPALTQNPGVLWQTPLAAVRVAAGAGQLTAANITDARPLPSPYMCPPGQVTITPSAADTVTTKAVTFPVAFAAPPRITLSLSSAVSGYNVAFWDSNVTTTGFTANLLRGSATATTLTWHAVSAS